MYYLSGHKQETSTQEEIILRKMTQKKNTKRTGIDIATEIIGGAAEALYYTDQEILDTLPKEQAHEFIELRNKVLAKLDIEKRPYNIGDNEDEDFSMAAEDVPSYE